MAWYIQLVIYLLTCTVSFIALWWVDFNKFVRVNKKQYSVTLYVIFALAIGYLIGKMFIELGSLFPAFV